MHAHQHAYYANIQHTDGSHVPSSEALTSGLQIGGRRRYVDATQYAGTGNAGNMPPYEAKYKWKRIA